MADIEFNLENNSIEIKRKIDGVMAAFLFEVSGEIVSMAAKNTRVKTGQTKGSWKAEVDEGKGEAIVGSPLENALWEEFGTGIYAVNGDGRKTPWAWYDEHGKRHWTRGKKPTHALQKAYEIVKPKAEKRMEQLLKGLD